MAHPVSIRRQTLAAQGERKEIPVPANGYVLLNLRPTKNTIKLTTVLMVMAESIHHCHQVGQSSPSIKTLSPLLHKRLQYMLTLDHRMLYPLSQSLATSTSLHSLASLSTTLRTFLYQCLDKVLVGTCVH